MNRLGEPGRFGAAEEAAPVVPAQEANVAGIENAPTIPIQAGYILGSKEFWRSKTFWGIAIGFIAPLVGQLMHRTFADADVQMASDIITNFIVPAASAAWGFYGRLKVQTTLVASKP
jgi:hypothetical protein